MAKIITHKQAEEILNFLQNKIKPHSYAKSTLVNWLIEDTQSETEYRVGGVLGFGAKLWKLKDYSVQPSRFYLHMDYYPEDQSPERDLLCQEINETLSKITGLRSPRLTSRGG